MSADFLQRMAEASRARARQAKSCVSEAALTAKIAALPEPPPLVLDDFDIIAELKLRSPAAGKLASGEFDRDAQIAAYAAGGACAVSVLTEPDEFLGSLEFLEEASAALRPHGRPTMRKDFLTDPYQVLEARAAGAGGVLIIVTMLDDATVRELLDCAREHGLFVLLEGFGSDDMERIAALDVSGHAQPVLAGVNCRDLTSLDVRFSRFAELAEALPRNLPVVAESGIASSDDIRAVASNGYALALVGSALMASGEPAATLADMIAAGRREAGSA